MKKQIIQIILGSDSDLGVVSPAAKVLDEFGISYKITVASAHRTPELVRKSVRDAEQNGTEVFIAAAGGAAALPGVIAAETVLPVIGIPVYTKSLNGLDSLFSIVQMPSGIPVATVGIDNAKNAGLLAIEILALKYKTIKNQLVSYKKQIAQEVKNKSDRLHKLGHKKYLETVTKK